MLAAVRAERFALIREAIDEYDVDGSESPWELGSFSRHPVRVLYDAKGLTPPCEFRV
jgi:hypothetical protein